MEEIDKFIDSSISGEKIKIGFDTLSMNTNKEHLFNNNKTYRGFDLFFSQLIKPDEMYISKSPLWKK